NDIDQPVGKGCTNCAADQPKQNALRQQLPDEPLPSRAECGADGELAFARCRTREQKLTDVRARDEQDTAAGGEQDEQGMSNFADPMLAQSNHARANLAVRLRILLREPLRDDAHLTLRLRN